MSDGELYRALVTPGAGATSGLWFSWVHWKLADGSYGCRSVTSNGGCGYASWDDAAMMAIAAVSRVTAELNRPAFTGWIV